LDTPAGIDLVIGRDLFTLLGITISGLPLPAAASPTAAPEDPVDSLVTGSSQNHPLANSTRLSDSIRKNQEIPRNSFCTIPESVVFLHTCDADPVFRRQYGIARSLEPIIDDQIRQWLNNGKVTLAPRGCQWNHPLLVVPKKTADGSKAPGRVCIDPRGLNRLLMPERFPMPRVRDVLQAMT
jgi:hypothetical protein